MVRAKFRVNSLTQYENAVSVFLEPVYSDDPESENKKFWDYTPSGKIELQTTNLEAAKQFEVAKEYYVDFTPA